MNVLVILPYHQFYPLASGGMNRYFHIIHQLSIYTNLTVITQADTDQIELARLDYPNLNKVDFLCPNQIELTLLLKFIPRKIAFAIYSRYLTWSLFKSANEVLLKFYHPTIELLKKQQFDFIVFENLASLDLAKAIKSQNPNVRQVYDAHNFDTEIAEADYKTNRINRNVLNQVRLKEAEIYKYIDNLWTCSERDAELFQKVNKKKIKKIHVIPNGTEITPIEVKSKNNPTPVILFVGSLDYFPNEEGLKWFLQKIIQNIESDFIFKIVGSGKCSIELKELIASSKKCDLVGFVEDLELAYLEADLVVIPILSGSGTRLKALEAMKYKKAIVSTSKGIEGIDIIDEIIIEDVPIKIAKAIEKILNRIDLKDELGIKARKLAEKTYDWNIIGETIKQALL
jgi:glycosyltransferase involved in cell wall biosynthesis